MSDITFFARGALDPDDDAVRSHEIVDGRALAQEFGVRGDVEFMPRSRSHHLGHLAVGADGHCGLGHDDGIAGQGRADLGGSRHDIGQIGMAVAASRGGAHCNKDGIRPCHRLGQIQRECQPASLDVLGHQVIKTRLEDWHFAFAQLRDLVRVLVDANHIMAKIRKTYSRDKAHIARSDHCNFHVTLASG